MARRAFALASAGAVGLMAGGPALAQVEVGKPSAFRKLVSADQIEAAAAQQYPQMLDQARKQGALAPDDHPQLVRLRTIARRLVPFTPPWNSRARNWNWEINLINSKQINAFCMPGGKIAFYTGILETLKLTDDETAMVMGHEMAHALREHARERVGKTQATGAGLSLLSQALGLGQLGDVAASLGTQLLSLRFSREDESEADLVGLELGARAAYQPQAGATLWRKFGSLTTAGSSGGSAKGGGPSNWLSTHPSGPDRVKSLESNAPKVQGLYEQARKG
jgi:Zn-dependent protease with chaperone function